MYGDATAGAAHGCAGSEDPAHARHRLAAQEPAFVEQPAVLAVELLEGVVGQDRRSGPVGDLEQEAVAAPDGLDAEVLAYGSQVGGLVSHQGRLLITVQDGVVEFDPRRSGYAAAST